MSPLTPDALGTGRPAVFSYKGADLFAERQRKAPTIDIIDVGYTSAYPADQSRDSDIDDLFDDLPKPPLDPLP